MYMFGVTSKVSLLYEQPSYISIMYQNSDSELNELTGSWVRAYAHMSNPGFKVPLAGAQRMLGLDPLFWYTGKD